MSIEGYKSSFKLGSMYQTKQPKINNLPHAINRLRKTSKILLLRSLVRWREPLEIAAFMVLLIILTVMFVLILWLDAGYQ